MSNYLTTYDYTITTVQVVCFILNNVFRMLDLLLLKVTSLVVSNFVFMMFGSTCELTDRLET